LLQRLTEVRAFLVLIDGDNTDLLAELFETLLGAAEYVFSRSVSLARARLLGITAWYLIEETNRGRGL